MGRSGQTTYMLNFSDRKDEAAGAELAGKKVFLPGPLKQGDVHVGSVARPLDLKDLVPWWLKATQDANQEKAGNLPITKVVVFFSGVDYFPREGIAHADQTVPVHDIDDLIRGTSRRDPGNALSAGRERHRRNQACPPAGWAS